MRKRSQNSQGRRGRKASEDGGRDRERFRQGLVPVWGSGFRVWGLGFRVYRVYRVYRVWGSGFRV